MPNILACAVLAASVGVLLAQMVGVRGLVVAVALIVLGGLGFSRGDGWFGAATTVLIGSCCLQAGYLVGSLSLHREEKSEPRRLSRPNDLGAN